MGESRSRERGAVSWTSKDGEKEIIPISDIIAKAVKDAKTK